MAAAMPLAIASRFRYARTGVSSMSESTLAMLYLQFAPAIYAHCRRLLHSPASARDATQEAFVRVLARGPALPEGEDALRYLYRVSTNVCLNQIRERRVHERAVPALAAHAGGAFRASEGGHADREFVTALLARCDETGGAIAVMHYVDGMTQVEIADILSITRRTVFNRLRKLESLADQLLRPSQAVAPAGGEEPTNTSAQNQSQTKDRR